MVIHDDAENDLDALYEVDEDGAAEIEVFLDEAIGSQDTLARLTEDHFRSYALDQGQDYDVKRWYELWKTCALWRVRLYDVPGVAANHRIIYAFHPSEQRIYVLGIVARSFDYDPKHPVSERIVAAYRDLDIP